MRRDSSILSRLRVHLPGRTAGRVWVLRNSPLVRWMFIQVGPQCLWLSGFTLSGVHTLCSGLSRSAVWGSTRVASPLWGGRAPRRVGRPLCWWQSKSGFLWSAWSVISARGSCGAGLLRGPQVWGLLMVFMDGGCQTLHHGPWVPAQVRWGERFALFVGFWAMVAYHAFPVSQVEVCGQSGRFLYHLAQPALVKSEEGVPHEVVPCP